MLISSKKEGFCCLATRISNALLDTGRRILQPKDYPCALCKITYGPFGMKKDWKDFVNSLPYPVTFLHKDEASRVLPSIAFSPPSLILVKDNLPIVLLQAQDFEKINNLEALKLKIGTLL